jgi:hypothetical protein
VYLKKQMQKNIRKRSVRFSGVGGSARDELAQVRDDVHRRPDPRRDETEPQGWHVSSYSDNVVLVRISDSRFKWLTIYIKYPLLGVTK